MARLLQATSITKVGTEEMKENGIVGREREREIDCDGLANPTRWFPRRCCAARFSSLSIRKRRRNPDKRRCSSIRAREEASIAWKKESEQRPELIARQQRLTMHPRTTTAAATAAAAASSSLSPSQKLVLIF